MQPTEAVQLDNFFPTSGGVSLRNGSSEFATYLVLLRNIWRSAERHYMGLHDVYLREHLLSCSLESQVINSSLSSSMAGC